MCFLYRQSISIVYESKFKYIYRYFIKIDRCFCGILQSLPLRKCGLKFNFHNFPVFCITSLPLRKCGLKYYNCNYFYQYFLSLPLRKCGLKSEITKNVHPSSPSLPLRKCGLKYFKPCIEKHFPCGSVD